MGSIAKTFVSVSRRLIAVCYNGVGIAKICPSDSWIERLELVHSLDSGHKDQSMALKPVQSDATEMNSTSTSLYKKVHQSRAVHVSVHKMKITCY